MQIESSDTNKAKLGSSKGEFYNGSILAVFLTYLIYFMEKIMYIILVICQLINAKFAFQDKI
jgi:hypothetical protein